MKIISHIDRKGLVDRRKKRRRMRKGKCKREVRLCNLRVPKVRKITYRQEE